MNPDDSLQAASSGEPEGTTSMGLPDLQSLMQEATAMQQRLVAAQHELDAARIEGSAGGGQVHATVTGTGELIGLTIDPEACDPDDPETLADMVLAAVRNAVDTAHRQAAHAMGSLTADFGGESDDDSDTSLW